jgi:hypothetical protein
MLSASLYPNKTTDAIDIRIHDTEVAKLLQGEMEDRLADDIMQAMRNLTGTLEYLVLQNIETMFTEGGVRSLQGGRSLSGAGRLASAVLATVSSWTGRDKIITGQVSVDLDTAPYARILEMGGITKAHNIRPVHADALAIPTSTVKDFYERLEERASTEWLLVYEVHHPGSRFQGRYYLRGALAELSRMVGPDINEAVANTVRLLRGY